MGGWVGERERERERERLYAQSTENGHIAAKQTVLLQVKSRYIYINALFVCTTTHCTVEDLKFVTT